MLKFFRFIIVFFLISIVPALVSGTPPRIVKFPEIESLLHNDSDSVIVLNFWATWCVPCVKELPFFEELKNKHPDEKLRIVLVSLDFKREFEGRVKSFIEKNKITSEVLLLDEPDHNSWINKVDSTWSGAIPATVIVTKDKKLFFEKQFESYTDVETIIKPLIQ